MRTCCSMRNLLGFAGSSHCAGVPLACHGCEFPKTRPLGQRGATDYRLPRHMSRMVPYVFTAWSLSASTWATMSQAEARSVISLRVSGIPHFVSRWTAHRITSFRSAILGAGPLLPLPPFGRGHRPWITSPTQRCRAFPSGRSPSVHTNVHASASQSTGLVRDPSIVDSISSRGVLSLPRRNNAAYIHTFVVVGDRWVSPRRVQVEPQAHKRTRIVVGNALFLINESCHVLAVLTVKLIVPGFVQDGTHRQHWLPRALFFTHEQAPARWSGFGQTTWSAARAH